jgi:hypothetical protein
VPCHKKSLCGSPLNVDDLASETDLMSTNKFIIMKINFISNLMVLNFYHEIRIKRQRE